MPAIGQGARIVLRRGLRDAGGQRGVRAKNLGGDDAVETQVSELEDLAHTARRRCARWCETPRRPSPFCSAWRVDLRRSDCTRGPASGRCTRRSGCAAARSTRRGRHRALPRRAPGRAARVLRCIARSAIRSSAVTVTTSFVRQGADSARPARALAACGTGVLGPAEAGGDSADRELLQLAEQDDFAVRVAQAFHGLLGALPLLVADHA